MAAQGQAGRGVIVGDGLRGGHRRQVRRRLVPEQAVIGVPREERQRRVQQFGPAPILRMGRRGPARQPFQRPHRPERIPPREAERPERIRLREPFQHVARQGEGGLQPFDAGIAVGPQPHEAAHRALGQAAHQTQPEADGVQARRLGGFEGAIPLAGIHADMAHLDAVGAGVADELRRLVEAHRLRVEDRGQEHIRVGAFHPGRGVDEEREARRVALGEAVGGEAADLREAAFAKACG